VFRLSWRACFTWNIQALFFSQHYSRSVARCYYGGYPREHPGSLPLIAVFFNIVVKVIIALSLSLRLSILSSHPWRTRSIERERSLLFSSKPLTGAGCCRGTWKREGGRWMQLQRARITRRNWKIWFVVECIRYNLCWFSCRSWSNRCQYVGDN